jgi:hypothetical protein
VKKRKTKVSKKSGLYKFVLQAAKHYWMRGDMIEVINSDDKHALARKVCIAYAERDLGGFNSCRRDYDNLHRDLSNWLTDLKSHQDAAIRKRKRLQKIPLADRKRRTITKKEIGEMNTRIKADHDGLKIVKAKLSGTAYGTYLHNRKTFLGRMEVLGQTALVKSKLFKYFRQYRYKIRDGPHGTFLFELLYNYILF